MTDLTTDARNIIAATQDPRGTFPPTLRDALIAGVWGLSRLGDMKQITAIADDLLMAAVDGLLDLGWAPPPEASDPPPCDPFATGSST